MTHSLLLKQQKLQMMNQNKHDNRQGHKEEIDPRRFAEDRSSICTITNEVKRIKITNHEKMKDERSCAE